MLETATEQKTCEGSVALCKKELEVVVFSRVRLAFSIRIKVSLECY